MRIDSKYSWVCAADSRRPVPQRGWKLSLQCSSFGSPLSVCVCRAWGVTVTRRLRSMCPFHCRGRLFPPHRYHSVNLGFPIKRDHTANVKYTLCVEHLIKYWLRTYMNLPHQIEAPVGGLPLICSLIWIWVSEISTSCCALHVSCVVNLFILLSLGCERSVQLKMKVRLHLFLALMLDLHMEKGSFVILIQNAADFAQFSSVGKQK